MTDIPLPNSKIDIKLVQMDAVREHYIVNGRSYKQDLTQTELLVMNQLKAASSQLNSSHAKICTTKILQATNRTCNGADSMYILLQLFEVPNLLIKSLQKKSLPVRIEITKKRHHVVVTTSTTLHYGLYKRHEIEACISSPEVWISIDAEMFGELRFALRSAHSNTDDIAGVGGDTSPADDLKISVKKRMTVTSTEALPPSHRETDDLF